MNIYNSYFKNDEKTIAEKIDSIDLIENVNEYTDKIHILFKNINIIDDNNKIIVNKEFFNEIKLNGFFKSITIFGDNIYNKLLNNPTNNLNILKQRQKNIQYLLNYKNKQDLSIRLHNIKEIENKILWFWNEETEDLRSLYEIVYFYVPYLEKYINKSELILNGVHLYKIFLSPLSIFLLPLLSFIIPLIFFYIFNIKISFGLLKNTFFFVIKNLISNILPNTTGKIKYISIFIASIYIFLYLQSTYNLFKSAYDTNKIINLFHSKLNYIALFIRNINELISLLPNMNILLKDKITNSLNYFTTLFQHNIFNDEPKLVSNKGKILVVYKQFLDNKDKLIDLLYYVGQIDVYYSLTSIMNNQNDKYCFTKYLSNKNKPIINTIKLWHPLVDKNKVISNSINVKNNLLITGPNKAGKSTFIKSVAINILLSQTFGIATAKKFVITPFYILSSYLNIEDSIGRESLFEAEMHRAKKYIELLKTNKDKLAFIVIDEIFTSTNYVEGYSASYAILKHISNYENNLAIVTTHYTSLSKLETNKGNIKNYKFIIEYKEDGTISYSYKIHKGISKQYIALELMKNDNFDTEILDDAIEIKNNISKNMFD